MRTETMNPQTPADSNAKTANPSGEASHPLVGRAKADDQCVVIPSPVFTVWIGRWGLSFGKVSHPRAANEALTDGGRAHE